MAIMPALFACEKAASPGNSSRFQKAFFKDGQEVYTKVQHALSLYSRNEVLRVIKSITYIEGLSKRFAVVFYQSNYTSGNVVVTQSFAGEQIIETITKCNGGDCSCLVNTVISDNGDIKLNCSCSTCTMMTDTN